MFLRLLAWEVRKLARRRSAYAGLAFGAAFCFAVWVGFQFSEFRTLRADAVKMGLGDPLRYINGLFFAHMVLMFSFPSLLPIFAAVTGGSQIAGEAKEGTLRGLLARPPSRPAVYLAKAAASLFWLVVTVAGLLALSLAVGVATRGGGDLLVFGWGFHRRGMLPFLIPAWEGVGTLALAALAAAGSLYLVTACALAFSACTDNPIVAQVGTLAIFFTSAILHGIPFLDAWIKDLMPTARMTFWQDLYLLAHPAGRGPWEKEAFGSDLAVQSALTLGVLLAGLVVFCRRDVRS